MTKAEQATFLDEILESTTKALKENLDRVPEHWDGIELRHWIASHVNEYVAYRSMDPKQKKAFKNDLIVRNL